MQETDPTQNQSKIPVGRRDFLKLTTIGAGVGTATIASMSVTGSAQTAEELRVRAKGGKLDDFLLNSNTKFEISWENVSRYKTIYLFLQIKTQDKDPDDEAYAGHTLISRVNSEQGSKFVPVTDFTERDLFGIVAQHDQIDDDDISVDLDKHEPGDSYERSTSFDLDVYAIHEDAAGDNVRDIMARRSDHIYDTDDTTDPLIGRTTVVRTITVEAILGAGIYFGKEFGVTHSELPEGIV